MVMIGPGFLHRTGFNGLLIPHPPVVNALLRKNLPLQSRDELIFAHEFAHFQTLPAVLLYGLVTGGFFFIRGTITYIAVMSILVGGQALWEMLSEAAVILDNRKTYHSYYQGVVKSPRIVFWLVTTMILVTGWIIAFL